MSENATETPDLIPEILCRTISAARGTLEELGVPFGKREVTILACHFRSILEQGIAEGFTQGYEYANRTNE